MQKSNLNYRDHIKPLVIADSIFTLGLVLLILIWQFGDDPGFMGGFLYTERKLMIGLGVGLALGGGIMMLNAIFKLSNARRQ